MSSASRATGDGAGLAAPAGRGVGPGQHRDHLVARRVDEPAQRRQRGFGGTGEDKTHRVSARSVPTGDFGVEVRRQRGVW